MCDAIGDQNGVLPTSGEEQGRDQAPDNDLPREDIGVDTRGPISETLNHIVNMLEEHKKMFANIGKSLVLMHDEQKKILRDMQVTLQDRQNVASNHSETSTSGSGNSSIIYTQSAIVPKFKDNESKHPIQFLEELEIYFKRMKTSEEDRLATAMECLHGPAQDWMNIYRISWMDYNDFKHDFLRIFWSESEQSKLRHQISTATWDSKKFTMSNHFAYYIGLARRLTNPTPEASLVAEIMRHFPGRLQSLWLLHSDKSITGTAEFLRQQETIITTPPTPAIQPEKQDNWRAPAVTYPARGQRNHQKPYPPTKPAEAMAAKKNFHISQPRNVTEKPAGNDPLSN